MRKSTDEKFMQQAITQAKKARDASEVPVGCVVVRDGVIIARGYNKRIMNADATAHAEVDAIRKACKKTGAWNLSGCDLYVTLEPCAMCAGAVINSRIDRLIFGAYDKRFGACGTLMNLANDPRFNHTAEVTGGVLLEECSQLLSSFFKDLRKPSLSTDDTTQL